MKKYGTSFLCVALISGVAFAGDATGRMGVGVAGGWDDLRARNEDRRGTNGDFFGSGWLRWGVSPRNEMFLSYDSIQLREKDDSSADRRRIRPVTLGLWHSLLTDRKLSPFVTIGLGAADVKLFGPAGARESKTVLAGQAGAGAEYFFCRYFSLGGMARGHYFYGDHQSYRTEGFAYSVGLMANLFVGGPARVEEKKAEVLPPAPVAEAVVETIAPPADEDKDGVPDSIDACPGTPMGTMVDARGCPKDSDADGVVDSIDQCPDTPTGMLVNEQGCPAEKVSVTLDVKFETGKAVLAKDSDTQLENVAGFMKRFPDTTIVVEGHTDAQGAAAFNKTLSQARAEAVRSALVDRLGVPAERISAQGLGSEQPVADNATPEGRAANRRVVATLTAVKK